VSVKTEHMHHVPVNQSANYAIEQRKLETTAQPRAHAAARAGDKLSVIDKSSAQPIFHNAPKSVAHPKKSDQDVAYLPPPPKIGPLAKLAGSHVLKPVVKPAVTSVITPTAADLAAIKEMVARFNKENAPQDAPAQEAALKQCLPKAEAVYGRDSSQFANYLDLLGTRALTAKDYSYAAQCFARALKIFEVVTDPESIEVGKCLSSIGLVAYKTGEPALARRYYDQSMRICHKHHHLPPWVAARYADLERDEKNYDAAEKLYKEGLNSKVQTGSVPVRKRMYEELIKIYQLTNRQLKVLETRLQESHFLKDAN